MVASSVSRFLIAIALCEGFILLVQHTIPCKIVVWSPTGNTFHAGNRIPLQTVEGSEESQQVGPTSESSDAKGQDDKRWNISQLLASRPPLHGNQNKTRMLEPEKWSHKYIKLRQKNAMEWLQLSRWKRSERKAYQPPAQVPGCLVQINHHYKFIWIKGKKVGGTALRENLGWICDDYFKLPGMVFDNMTAHMEHCTKRLWNNDDLNPEDLQWFWDNYYVFAFVRNPYARFASSYKYVDGLTPGRCPHFPFHHVCVDPFIQARSIRLKRCGSFDQMFDRMHHLMEQTSCLFTDSGESVVDYVGHTETMTSDFQEIARQINSRLGPSDPKLNETLTVEVKNRSNRNVSSLDLYMDAPACLRDVEMNFAVDFKKLGYERDVEWQW